ncbi:hypothetical protein KIPB_005989, partial [Kipferlia bialata]|eukprot:g5989.t1
MLRVGVVGPPRSGKSTLSNVYCHVASVPDPEYRPTQCLRVTETERSIDVQGVTRSVAVQLWDIGGSEEWLSQHMHFRPMLDGVAFVIPADDPSPASTLQCWWDRLVDTPRITQQHCLVLRHSATPD